MFEAEFYGLLLRGGGEQLGADPDYLNDVWQFRGVARRGHGCMSPVVEGKFFHCPTDKQ